MQELDDSKPGESGNDLPELMQAIPAWYPGAWGPPAETLTYASILVSILGIVFLSYRDVDRALFRFPFPPYLLAAPATILALWIVYAGKSRPGHWIPRVWALALAGGSLAITVLGIVEQFRSGRTSPIVNILSFVALLSALALAPRLLKISPFSFWVQHLAPASLVWVALLCLVSGTIVRNEVIRRETERISESIGRLNSLAGQIDSAQSGDLATGGETLAGVSLTTAMPDTYVWIAARGLQHQPETKDLLQNLTAAVENLTRSVGRGYDRAENGELGLSPVSAGFDDWNESTWTKEPKFAAKSAPVLHYYREMRRLQTELDDQMAKSPNDPAYLEELDHLHKKSESVSQNIENLWLASVITGESSKVALDGLLQGHFDDNLIPLGSLNRWKFLPLRAAESMRGSGGCIEISQKPWRETKPKPIPGDQYGRTEPVYIYHANHRVECYAYRRASDGDAVEVAAELHLTYFTQHGDGESTGYGKPVAVRLYFEVPRGTDADKYANEVVQDLEASAPGQHPQSHRISRIDGQPCILITLN